MRYLTVVPAYGRDYKSKAAAVADWNAGKDFVVQDVGAGRDNGRAVSKSDLEGQQVTVNIRYKRLTMVANVPPEKGTPAGGPDLDRMRADAGLNEDQHG
jgi:hypothetical protein